MKKENFITIFFSIFAIIGIGLLLGGGFGYSAESASGNLLRRLLPKSLTLKPTGTTMVNSTTEFMLTTA